MGANVILAYIQPYPTTPVRMNLLQEASPNV
jgi:hypothetical protein